MKNDYFIPSLVVFILALLYGSCQSGESNDVSEISENSRESTILFVGDSLINSEGIHTVRAFCTGCHSEQLITQNRATRDGWESMIRWMQQTQNLGDLGDNESLILDYLAENYSPNQQGRRAPLVVEWYELSE